MGRASPALNGIGAGCERHLPAEHERRGNPVAVVEEKHSGCIKLSTQCAGRRKGTWPAAYGGPPHCAECCPVPHTGRGPRSRHDTTCLIANRLTGKPVYIWLSPKPRCGLSNAAGLGSNGPGENGQAAAIDSRDCRSIESPNSALMFPVRAYHCALPFQPCS